jgi:hypothetical protein
MPWIDRPSGFRCSWPPYSVTVTSVTSAAAWSDAAPPLHLLRPQRRHDAVSQQVSRTRPSRSGRAARTPTWCRRAVDNILDVRYVTTVLPEFARRGAPLELFYEVKANITRDQVRLLYNRVSKGYSASQMVPRVLA